MSDKIKVLIIGCGNMGISHARASEGLGSSDIDSHTKTNCVRKHQAELDGKGNLTRQDVFIDTSDEPDHQELCNREQAYLLKAITEDIDLTEHLDDAINSLRIVLGADKSVLTGQVVSL